MPNTLGYYTPEFFANEAIALVEAAGGLAGRLYRGYDEERRGAGFGEYINIRRPGTFTAQDSGSASQAINTGKIQLRLTQQKEVKFELTDFEMATTDRQAVIQQHLRPAAYALLNHQDVLLNQELGRGIPWVYDVTSTPTVADVVKARRILFDNKVPLIDPTMMHFEVNGAMEEGLLNLTAFNQNQGAGQEGVQTQMDGYLGRKFGFNFFSNQNVYTHTAGVAADSVGALTANAAAGDTSIAVGSVTTAGTFKNGDTLVIAGDTQRYTITADATASGGAVTLSVQPPLVKAYSTNDVVTIDVTTGKAQNLAFHRNIAAIAFGQLPDSPAEQKNADIATVTDPKTGLSMRATTWYDPDAGKRKVKLDWLWGWTFLDRNLGVRARL